jgi:hypothetical protein
LGLLILAVTAFLGAVTHVKNQDQSATVVAWAVGAGIFVMALGIGGLTRNAKIERLLKSQVWVNRRADYRVAYSSTTNGEPALRIYPDEYGPEAIYSIPTTVSRYRSLPQGANLPVLVIKTPSGGAIVAPPDRSVVLFARRPRTNIGRRFLKRLVIPPGSHDK